jgi:DNA polymerase III sliding clamp (beta) subunit (PCNA family)
MAGKAKFPAWEEVVPKACKHELRVLKNDLLQALDRVAAASMGDRARGVVLHLSGEGLEISSENPKAGEMKVEVPASGWTDDAVIERLEARFTGADRPRLPYADSRHKRPSCHNE